MKVLSLFDGISCGQLALKQLRIPIERYYASEIHFPSTQVTQSRFPTTIQLGDVRYIKWQKHFGKIDLLIGGSPCQGFSQGGKRQNFKDPRSRLFYEYVRLLKEAKPKKFLLENVRMDKKSENTITKALGVAPIYIDSKIFSAQRRKRIYWTNIKIEDLPRESELTIKNILTKPPLTDRSFKIAPSMWRYLDTHPRRILTSLDKSHCITTKQERWDNTGFVIDRGNYRYFTPIEIERLQGLPDNYTKGLTTSQRYNVIGNGWQIDTIKHIFKNLK